jgi:hypothetical protein
MEKRVIMRIEVDPRAKLELDDYCDHIGMTKVAAVSRLIEWFCNQPESVQGMVQGLFPSIIKMDVAEIMLKRLLETKHNGKAFKANGRRINGRLKSPGLNGAKSRSQMRVA